MVVTPFFQILGSLVCTGVSEVVITDNIDDEADALTVSCETSTASMNQEIKAMVLSGYKEGYMWLNGLYSFQAIESKPAGEHLIFTSAAFTEAMKEKRDTSYQKLTIKDLVGKVAKRHSLKVKCDMEQQLEHVDQKNESDLALLQRFAKKYNAIFNIKNDTLIFISKSSEDLPHFIVTADQAQSWNLRGSRKFYYKSVKAKYHEHKKNKAIEIIVGSGKPEYVIEQPFKSKQEARDLAKAKLEQLTAQSQGGTITLEGQNIIAGGKVVVIGFGLKNDGEYLITKVEHKGNKTFTSTITLEKSV